MNNPIPDEWQVHSTRYSDENGNRIDLWGEEFKFACDVWIKHEEDWAKFRGRDFSSADDAIEWATRKLKLGGQ